ncbi:NDP-hexose 2,3-dehydratase family protein [Kordiimonas marina]|uniref:NDP-hexose 2,3-dehydratase family protein n=1 Tax=Kordiimonas marina TaxID=2872312 RepID=UPI001FF157D1|nr:NDP-hexose 2,3-dehydratase family protein [Kordiimonas marina]MCJ9429080.1 NDP-hexose 2,3-dehydratase family protein [Kordiimonas marina]
MLEWLGEQRNSCGMRYRPIPFSESLEWAWDDGRLRHRTGGFFSLEGVEVSARHPSLDGWRQPIINQPEVGILGFVLVGTPGSYRWLVQAKAEPGNVGGVQLAPTVQATYSNYTRRHGGAETCYLSHFLEDADSLVSDSLQSEQGTRFLRKFNRNAVQHVGEAPDVAGASFTWMRSGELRAALADDYTVNTDARSVLVTAPWLFLARGETPFDNPAAHALFGQSLAASYLRQADPCALLAKLKAGLDDLRQRLALTVSSCSLLSLGGWRITDGSLRAETGAGALEVCHYAVEAPNRERPAWDQPLVQSREADEVILFCQKHEGVMRFMVRPCFEVGLTGGVEWGPSYKRESLLAQPDWLQALVASGDWRTLISAEQSDEGGRFMLSRCRYRVAEVPVDWQRPTDMDDIIWLTAAELEQVARVSGFLTNEARSALSLLLSLA